MHINIHAHLFTLRTVLSREAIRVMTQRLRDRGFPDFLVDAIEKVFDDLLNRPTNLDERELLGRIVAKLKLQDSFDHFLNTQLAGSPIALTVRAANVEDLSIDVLRQVIDKITTKLDSGNAPGKSAYDVIQAIRIGMLSTITEVADELLEQMETGDALVALMMDIHGPEDPDRDRKNFLSQIEGTEEAALQRPGRVLPFFAVHPERADTFDLMKEAIESRGFLGVKLYPSLGYEIAHPALLKVYRYCLDQDVPILLHCGHGGFYRQEAYREYCNPEAWVPVLQGDLANLRVCFAHFGGWQSLGQPNGLDPGEWGETILRLMHKLTNVFTDLAYHTDQMKNPADEDHYFRTLAKLLTDTKLRTRIMFGTDSWLLRLDMADIVYRKYFQSHMTAADFDVIAESAPRAFLGFPEEPGGAMRANLRRYIDHMAENRGSVGADPAPWLREAVGKAFDVTRESPDWSPKRTAVRRTYQGLGGVMTASQKKRTYKVNRTLPLSELIYYRPHDPNFEEICLNQARKFLQFAKQGANYRGGHDDTTAVELLAKTFRRGDKALVDVAVQLDSILEFEKPIA